MSQNVKKIMQEEYIKCAKDPSYFIYKYCYIQHPQRGRIQFALYPFQKKVLKLFTDNPYNIVLKSRQLGLSTLAAGYSLWLMLFHENRNVLALATTQATARNLVTKVQFMFHHLPSWLKIETVENNKLSLWLTNGSRVQARSSNSDAARSEAVSLLLIDEAAFIDNIEETWTSAQQTLATGGSALVLSTPNGTGNWFHKMWAKAESNENDFLPIRLPWFVHPERDQKWRDRQDELLGDPRKAAQECDCDFATSGDTVFYGEYIDFIEKTHVKEPLERRGADGNLWVWESVDYSRAYMVTADISRGDGDDYSTFHVIDIEANTQVAEYKGQMGTKEFGYFLASIATEYNNALLAPENATVGWNTIQAIIDRGYRNLYYTPKSGEVTADSYFNEFKDLSKMTPGFTMSTRTRPICIGKLQESVSETISRQDGIIIRSRRVTDEMRVFIWKGGKAQAQQGYNDDLIMPLAMSQYIRETAFKFKQHGIDLTKSMLNNTSTTQQNYLGVYAPDQSKKYWNMDNPYSGGEEDITWLL